MRVSEPGLRAALLGAVFVALAGCSSDGPKEHRWYPNGKPRSEDWHSPVSMLMKYDANHDGTVTRAELESGLRAEFDAADKNHTGCLDPDEVRAINEERTKSDEAAASPLIDWKKKRCIDVDEYATTARSLFEQLDRDGNGKLTPNELRAAQRKNQPQGEQRPNGGGY
jgi:Ca2+-binding EF-hand superfamily protein